MILVAVTVSSTIVIMFYFPEVSPAVLLIMRFFLTNYPQTSGLSLEEINAKFGDKVEVELKDALDSNKTEFAGRVDSSKLA
jgi:hypothetical protein